MKRKKIVSILFWIGFVIYGISLLLPYQGGECLVNKENIKIVRLGKQIIFPFFTIIPITILFVTCFTHSTISRWIALITGIGQVLFGIPLMLVFVNTWGTFLCTIEPQIGVYFYSLSALLLFIASIVNFRIPVSKELSKDELLDNDK